MSRPRSTAEEMVYSARRLINLLLQKDSGILPEHRQEALEVPLWKITEAEGKYAIRFRSSASLSSPEHKAIHEHVFRIASLAKELVESRPEDVDDLIKKKAVACIVTEEEHVRLHLDKSLDGWERYR